MPLIAWIGIFVLSLAVLIKASDYFTDSAENVGVALGLPPFLIGVTIVAMGTSLPELASSIFSVIDGSTEIVIGNVVGSNITNIFLVLGVTVIVARKKLKITHELIHVDLPILVASSFLLAFAAWDGVFTFPEAILFLLGLLVYIIYTVVSEREDSKEAKEEINGEIRKRKFDTKDVLTLIVSGTFIFLGAKYTIDSVTFIASGFNIQKELIALSAIALGTSLPELMVSTAAARKGKAEIAIGNILGSNIFNTFAVMGIPALFKTLVVPDSVISFSLPLMVAATLIYFFMTQDREITKWEGGILIIFYVFFIGKLFGVM